MLDLLKKENLNMGKGFNFLIKKKITHQRMRSRICASSRCCSVLRFHKRLGPSSLKETFDTVKFGDHNSKLNRVKLG